MALLGEFGWRRSVLAGAFSVFALVHGLLSPPLGWLGDRFGPRRLVLVGGTVLCGALLLDSLVRAPWHLYLAFGVLTSIGVAAAGWVPAVVLVQRSFPRRIGLSLGVTSAGIGVGIFVVVPLCQWLIDGFGWRWTFRFIAAAVALWILPGTLWFVRDPPRGGPVVAAPSAGRPATDMSLAAAVTTARFWLLALAQFLGNFTCQMLLVHQVAYLVDHAIPALVAASVVSLVGLSSVVGKAGGGWLSDTIGRELTYTLGLGCVVASIGALGLVALAPGRAPAYLYGLLVGVGYSVTAPLMPAVISDLFRGRHYGVIFGTLHLANAFGGSAGPLVAGWVFDTTGSYAGALRAAALSAAAAAAAIWIAGPRRYRPR